MTTIGTIKSLWRYPVKSMGGEELQEAFMGFSGFYGDRCYAIKNAAATRKGFPYLNAPLQPEMLRFRPQFRHPERAKFPPNLEESANIAIGVTPSNADTAELDLNIVTPTGEILAVDDPRLLQILVENLRGEYELSVVRSDRALTDCRPVSLISKQTIQQIQTELEFHIDLRRFRANVYLDLISGDGFGEDKLVGRRLRIGSKAEIMILERDPRCKMISLDPDTGEHDPKVFRKVAQSHDANAGVYCAVLVEGILTNGDSIQLLD
jgi:uncharacterized protein YcbX